MILTLLKMLNVCGSGIFSKDAENGLNACTDPQIEGLWCMHAPLPESTLNPTPTPEMYKTTDCISTFDYIQTEYINMELKQSK